MSNINVTGQQAYFNEDAKFFKDVYIYGTLYYEFESKTKEIFGDIEVTGDANFLSDVYINGNLNVGILTVRQRLDVGVGGTILRAISDLEGLPFSTGKVGIGSTAPKQSLDVTGIAVISEKVGIGSVEPQQRLDVAGSIKIDETIYDSTNAPGRNGYYLVRDDIGVRWIPLVAEYVPGSPGINTDGVFILNEGVPLNVDSIPCLPGIFSNYLVVSRDYSLSLNLGTLMDAYTPINRDWAFYKLERNTGDYLENYVNGINIGNFTFNKRNSYSLAILNGTTQYFKTDPVSTSRGFLGNTGDANNTVVLWFWFDSLPTSNKFLWIASNSTQTIYSGLRFNSSTNKLEYVRYSQGLYNTVVVSTSTIVEDSFYTVCCRYNGSTGLQEIYLNKNLENSTTSLTALTINVGDVTNITAGYSINEGYTSVCLGHLRLAGILLTDPDIQRLMTVPTVQINFGETIVDNQWIILFNDTKLDFTVPSGLPAKVYSVYATIDGISNTPINVQYIDFPLRTTDYYIRFDNENQLNACFDKMTRQWGGSNGGVVSENVSIGSDDVGETVLVLECHGDNYAGTVQGVDRFGDPKFNPDGTPWVKRVGSAVVSKNYFGFGSYEYTSKVVQVLGVASAFWNFHYVEIYPDDPRWDYYKNTLGLHLSGNSTDGYYIVRNNEIDIEIPSHLLPGGIITEPSLSNGKFNTWRGELQNYDVPTNDPAYYEEYRDNYRPLGYAAPDNQYHVYRYDWYHDRVEFYVDGVLIVTNINNAPGYNNSNNIPDVPGKVTIGPWFPSSATPWAGTVANFSIEKMYVRSFKYIPFTDEITNYQVIVGETYGTYTSLGPGSNSV